jgi:hypothetical protein
LNLQGIETKSFDQAVNNLLITLTAITSELIFITYLWLSVGLTAFRETARRLLNDEFERM